MGKSRIILILLSTLLLNSCYKKQYEAAQIKNRELQGRIDSTQIAYVALENNANQFLHDYFKLPMGAMATPDTIIKKSDKYQISKISAPVNFLYNPANLSPWGNFQYGNCVTAEEAFAKACNNPEIFIPEGKAIQWADQNGVLHRAYLVDVLSKMKDVGFRTNNTTYNVGSYSYVDFKNSSLLKDAISQGPVKIGLAGNQLSNSWKYFTRGWFALDFQPETINNNNGHCASLCGYGTLSWLAQQFNVPLPNGVDGQKDGFAIFTWGSIGIIDYPSLLAITREAWLRRPTTVINNSVSSYILKAMGGETNSNLYLSHAHGDIKLMNTYPGGFGEMWIGHDIGNGKILLQPRGKESDFVVYLSHANGNLQYSGRREGGEEWIVHKHPNGEISLEAGGAEKGWFLSHGNGKLQLSKNFAGGEAWLNVGQQ